MMGSHTPWTLQVERISEPLLACITAQVLQGLSYLHRQHTVRTQVLSDGYVTTAKGYCVVGFASMIMITISVTLSAGS
jgi:hypothetical protein